MIDVERLRGLAAELSRAEDKYPNPFYVGFGAAILEAIGDQPTNDIDAIGHCCCAGCIGMGPCDLDPISSADDGDEQYDLPGDEDWLTGTPEDLRELPGMWERADYTGGLDEVRPAAAVRTTRGDTVKLHPRTLPVQRAEVDLHGWLIGWQAHHDLTALEALACIHAAAARIAKYALRSERHPDDPDCGADQERNRWRGEAESLTDQLSDMRATMSAAEAEVDYLRAANAERRIVPRRIPSRDPDDPHLHQETT